MGLFLGITSALWLGILTSISPCPLTTNIAAISFISRRVGNPRRVILTGLLYTLGRALTYSLLGVLLVSSLLSAPYISYLLQKYMNKILGPLLILAGMFLSELIQLNISGSGINERMQKRVERWGIWGAAWLGILFALSFCPVSAALFFGSLIPLAIKYNSSTLLSCIFGIGTALPVFLFAILIALSARSLGKAFDSVTQIECWARQITGVIFIGVGVYLSLVYIFGLFTY
jgi:cytochrome c-type biogenesis protein